MQQAVRGRLNNLRCLDRLLTSREFETAFNNATPEDRQIVIQAIEREEYWRVERWITIKERDRMRIDDLTVRELRRLASGLSIPGYHLLTRAVLLERVKNVDRAVNPQDSAPSH